jgi:hypothetical protein
MGSFFKGKKAPAPPPPPAPKIVQDLINGVETVTETRDGKEYIVTRQLPLTPEQQAFKDDITKRLDNIDKMSEGLAILNPEFAPMVQSLRAWQQQTRGQLFGEAARAQQDELARRGLGNSTAAANASLQLGRQMGEQVQQDELNLFGLSEQARADALQRQQTGLTLRRDVNQQNLQNLSTAGQNTANTQQSRLSLDAGIQQQNYQNQLTAFQSQRPSLGSQLLSVAAQAGMAYTTGGLSTLGSQAASSGGLGGLFGMSAAKASTGTTPQLRLNPTLQPFDVN